jgi:hypothetical protein
VIAAGALAALVSCTSDHVTNPRSIAPTAAVEQLGLSSAFDSYAFLPFLLDVQGANDQPAQVDLNGFTRADNVSGKLGVAWTWDDINAWTGSGQTGDACALFDTSNPSNGNADYAICVRITNDASGANVFQLNPGSPIIYSCGDSKTDRCSQPVTSIALGTTFCEVVKSTELFPGEGDDGQDVLAACSIDLSAIGNATKTNILNVCSFPSGEPNSNAFDCIVKPGAGFLEIKKKTTPQNSGKTFNFTLSPAASDGNTTFSLTDNTTGDEATALIAVTPGTFSITESSIPTGWQLNAASCLRDGSTSTGTKSGNAVTGIATTIGTTTVCTFENIVAAPTLTVDKTADPTTLPETGGNVTFSVVVTNTALTSVTLTTLSDDVYGNLNGVGTCVTGGTIAASGTYSCAFTKALAAGSAGDVHKDTVSATVTNSGGSASGKDGAEVTYTDVAPTLTVTKTPSPTTLSEPGGSVTFTVVVNNTSAESVTLTTLTDNVFGTLSTIAGTTCATGGSIVAGGSYSCTFTKTLSGNAGTTHRDTVTATIKDDENTTATAKAGAAVTFTNINPNISVTKTANPTSINTPAAGTLTFTADRTYTSTPNPGSGFYFASPTCDDAGPNDQPAQVDLNCFNRADNVSGKLGVQWSWDDINSWGGTGQTGDACALIDTDNDGNANVAICARISNNPDGTIYQVGGAGAADVYLCNDTKSDRCAKQVTQVLGTDKGTTTCGISTVTPDQLQGGEDGSDVVATCSIDLSMVGLAGKSSLDLLNVCSFPSGEPNSNPFDCVVQVGAAFIQIVKATDITSTQLFGFTLAAASTDGTSKYAVQAGVSTGLIPVTPGTNYSITETNPTNWSLQNVSCTVDGQSTGTKNVAQNKITGITAKTGQTTVCTFTNAGLLSGSVTYTVTVTNLTAEAVSLFSLNDDKFGNLNGTGTCATGGTIAGSGNYSCTFTKTLSGAAGTSHTNTVTAVAKDDEANSVTKTASATVNFVAP